jgi:membrane protease YdiL (CAAX protease family)
MSTAARELSGSAFIADLPPAERSLGRFAVTVVLGVIAYVVAAVVGLFISFALLIAAAGWPAPTSVAGLQALVRRLAELAQSDGKSFSDTLQALAVAIPDNLLPIYAIIGVALLVHRPPVKAFITSAPRFRWRLLLAGAGLSALIIGPFVGVSQLFDPAAQPPPLLTVSPDLGLKALYTLICVVCFAPAAFGEEMLFRGWLLRETSGATRNPIALMAINGVVFAAAHLQFAPDAFLERAILGAAFTYMTLRLGGIEFSTGAHLANNLMIVLFLEPLTLKVPTSDGVTAGSLAQYAYLIFAYGLMTEIVVRWPALRRWTEADAATRPGPARVAADFS